MSNVLGSLKGILHKVQHDGSRYMKIASSGT
jgi:hypothetical protein